MRKYGLSFLLCILFLLLLLFPDIAKSGAQDGLYLWYNSIVPILFPFIILSNLMISTDSFSWFLRPFFLIKKIIPVFQPWYFYSLILGFFCGYPMGAKAISDLTKKGKITIREGNMLLPLINQASPMFLAGYVGVHILNNTVSLSRLFFLIYVPPLLLFLIYCFVGNLSSQSAISFEKNNVKKQKDSMSPSMEHTILDSFFIIVTIGVYMMLFSILMKLIHTLLPHSDFFTIGSCFLEFSTGLHTLNELTLNTKPLKYSLILSLTSFGGFCTAAQTHSIIKDTGISMKVYFIGKGMIALFVFLITYSSISSS